MRLDLCLKHSGIVKRRTVAKYFCERGLVKINDRVGKPSSEVKDGDYVSIKYGEKEVRMQVSLRKEGRVIYVGYTLVEDEKVDA
ncbi:MAG: RNA-binding S4 domain-containing protein [Erysipelotrichaceae bacterium]|nr:RNA-binding S4 domain-containing protein [Erysipelotrichaceae bacterium]